MNKISFLALTLVALATMASSAASVDSPDASVLKLLRGQINHLTNHRKLPKACGDSDGADCCHTGGKPSDRVHYCLEGYGCNSADLTCGQLPPQAALPALCYPSATTDFCSTEGTDCDNSTSDEYIECDEKICNDDGGKVLGQCIPSCGEDDFPIPDDPACCGVDTDGDPSVFEETYCF